MITLWQDVQHHPKVTAQQAEHKHVLRVVVVVIEATHHTRHIIPHPIRHRLVVGVAEEVLADSPVVQGPAGHELVRP